MSPQKILIRWFQCQLALLQSSMILVFVQPRHCMPTFPGCPVLACTIRIYSSNIPDWSPSPVLTCMIKKKNSTLLSSSDWPQWIVSDIVLIYLFSLSNILKLPSEKRVSRNFTMTGLPWPRRKCASIKCCLKKVYTLNTRKIFVVDFLSYRVRRCRGHVIRPGSKGRFWGLNVKDLSWAALARSKMSASAWSLCKRQVDMGKSFNSLSSPDGGRDSCGSFCNCLIFACLNACIIGHINSGSRTKGELFG